MRYKQRLVGITPAHKEGDARWFFIRNGDYVQRVGDILTKAVRYKPRNCLEDFVHPPEIVEEKQTNIKIVAITAYGKDLDEIGEGTTGAMLLEGDVDWLNYDWCFE